MSLGEDVARWLRWAGTKKHGDNPLSVVELHRASGVTRPSIYRILDASDSTEPDEQTLTRLAVALGVEPPKIERVLRVKEEMEPPRTPLSWLSEARASMDQAIRLLRSDEGGAGAEVDEIVQEILGQDDARRARRKGRKRAGGE